MNKGLREALVAMQAFAEAMRRQYIQNLELFHTPRGPFSNPLSKTTPFPQDGLASAQTYTEKGESYFVVLARLEGAEVSFDEAEALIWLGNDAVIFDAGVRSKELPGNEKFQILAQMHAERAVARAIYLRALLGGYVRSLDADLFKRAMNKEPSVGEAAAAAVKHSVQEFEQAITDFARTAAFQQEIIGFGQSVEFPLFPLAMGRKLADKDMMNGALLPPDIAQQLREHAARRKQEREQH